MDDPQSGMYMKKGLKNELYLIHGSVEMNWRR